METESTIFAAMARANAVMAFDRMRADCATREDVHSFERAAERITITSSWDDPLVGEFVCGVDYHGWEGSQA